MPGGGCDGAASHRVAYRLLGRKDGSLVAQSYHGIDFHGAAGGDVEATSATSVSKMAAPAKV